MRNADMVSGNRSPNNSIRGPMEIASPLNDSAGAPSGRAHLESYLPARFGGTARSLNCSPLIFAPQVPGMFTSRLTSS